MNTHREGTEIFLAIQATVERHARFAFRGMRDVHRHEDCVQETLCLCWLWTCRLWKQGKDARDFPTTLATFATRHVRSGRTFVGKKRLTGDALSPLAQAMHAFGTQTLPSGEAPAATSWQAALLDNTQSPPDEQAAFRIDFPAFLGVLSDRDRRIAQDMMMGETTRELSGRYRVSPARISQLRREFHAGWHALTGATADPVPV